MKHYNKTLATLLATVFGGLGLHRLYLHGIKDRWLWLHVASWIVSGGLYLTQQPVLVMFCLSPAIVSILAGWLTALVLGLTPDEKWDAKFNPQSGRHSDSGWPLALLLVLTMMTGATGLIAAMARLADLAFTGGAFG